MINSKISIIIPIYNAEKYLEKCLDSIVKQTYKNIEIICVNDGSKDNSINILYRYNKMDNRIVLINKENNGLSSARNIGLASATGEFVMFVDSDDWIDIDTCEKCLKIMNKYSVDVVMFSYVREYENKSNPKIIFNEDIFFDEKDTYEKIYRRFFGLYKEELAYPQNADAIVTVWGKLYRSKIILDNHIEFIDTKKIGTCEDALFNIEVFKHVKNSYFLNKCFYHYRKDNLSFTSYYRENLNTQWSNLYILMENQIKENNLDSTFNEALSNRIALNMIGLGLNTVYSSKNFFSRYNELKKIVKSTKISEAIDELDLKYFPLHWKVFFLCIKYKFILCYYFLSFMISKIIKN